MRLFCQSHHRHHLSSSRGVMTLAYWATGRCFGARLRALRHWCIIGWKMDSLCPQPIQQT